MKIDVMYLCDPEKNVECRKSGCLYRLMGSNCCFLTSNPLYARDGAQPYTQDMLNEAVPEIQSTINMEMQTFYDKLEHELLYGTGGPKPVGLVRDKSKGWE